MVLMKFYCQLGCVCMHLSIITNASPGLWAIDAACSLDVSWRRFSASTIGALLIQWC